MKEKRSLWRLVSASLVLILCLSGLSIPPQAALAESLLAPLADPTGIGTATPSSVFVGEASLLTVVVTPGTGPVSSGLVVTADLTTIGGLAIQPFLDDGLNGDVTDGDNIFSFRATVAPATLPGAKTFPVTITDAQDRSGSTTISLFVKPPLVAIHTIQGAAHLSPLVGQYVTTMGIVTAVRSNGFYLQEPDLNADADAATSEGIFFFTTSAPTVLVGDLAEVVGTVLEFRPGGSDLTTTELGSPGRWVRVESSGNPLPLPTVIGAGGRVPPNAVIEDDAAGDVETSGVFDPDLDGIDFYESLEGMLVQVNDAVAVGPTSDFSTNREIPVVADNGANAGLRTGRGGIIIQQADFNPERIILNDWITGGPDLPPVNVGDTYPGAILGVIDYSFSNFKLQVTQLPALVLGGLAREVTDEPPVYQLHVGTFNVENLAPTDPPSKFSELASLIVDNLLAPDLLAIEEIQDNTGATDDGVVDASTTWGMLINAIQAAGGPVYEYRQIDPVNNEDGGAPGRNIRQGFLFRTDRGLEFVESPGGDATTPTAVTGTGSDTALTLSPGRVDPTNLAFTDSRKPLAGEFTFKGDKVFVVANHFNSKSGDKPLFGLFQPPVLVSEVQRMLQAQAVHDFTASILAADPNANVIVMGDLNDFHFSNPILALVNTILNNLIETLPAAERYTYVYQGNSEDLDHIMLSTAPFGRPFEYDIVHVNSEFADQASDHDPQAAQVCVDATPPELTVTINGTETRRGVEVLWPPNHKYRTVTATVLVTDNADPNPIWDLVSVTSNEADNSKGDGNTLNDIVVVSDTEFELRAERSGLSSGRHGRQNGRVYAITYEATDACGNRTETIANVYVPHDMGQSLRMLIEQYPQNTPLPISERWYLYPYVTYEGMLFMPMVIR